MIRSPATLRGPALLSAQLPGQRLLGHAQLLVCRMCQGWHSHIYRQLHPSALLQPGLAAVWDANVTRAVQLPQW